MHNLKKIIASTLILQLVLVVVVTGFAYLLSYQVYSLSLFMGGLISIFGLLPAWFVSRRFPLVVSNKVFFTIMAVCEILKWSTVVIVTIFLLEMYPNLRKDGLIMGFAITYFGSYFGVLLFKR